MRLLTDILRSRVLPAIIAALGVSFIAAGLLSYTTGADADLFPFPSDATAFVGDPSPNPSDDIVVLDPTGSPEPTASATPFPLASGSFDLLPSPLTSDFPEVTPEPSAEPSADPSASVDPSASADASASVDPSAGPGNSADPSGSPASSAQPGSSATPKPTSGTAATPKPKPTPTTGGTSSGNRVATRVVIPALDIDLPIVRPPGGSSTYPLCNVAMYIQTLKQPGGNGAIYLYAHARAGMFLPLLSQSKISNGKGMLGMLVQIYTSDNQYFLYQIDEVRRHQLTLNDALAARDEELWLQTSEGPRGTPGKLQVIAKPISNGPASQADAHPTPHPVVCG